MVRNRDPETTDETDFIINNQQEIERDDKSLRRVSFFLLVHDVDDKIVLPPILCFSWINLLWLLLKTNYKES